MGKKGTSVNPFGARTKSVTRYSLQVNQNKFVLKCTYCHNQCSQILNYDSNLFLFFFKEAHSTNSYNWNYAKTRFKGWSSEVPGKQQSYKYRDESEMEGYINNENM